METSKEKLLPEWKQVHEPETESRSNNGIKEEINVANDEWSKSSAHRNCVQSSWDKVYIVWMKIKELAYNAYEMGKSDPRKVWFAGKMGSALALISIIIFYKEPTITYEYNTWAIMTVVVVFEFSVGATFSKGLNRAFGTFSAGALSVGIGYVSKSTGVFEDTMIVISVFIAGFGASYAKLYPTLKEYEYGFRVFLITYCIVLVSDSSDFLDTAVTRLLLIAIGAAVCLVINTFIYPIWSGEDLHKLVVKNFKGVAKSLEGCVNGYILSVQYSHIPSNILTFQQYDDPLYNGYRSAVESASQEESLMTFASWEPPHGPYKKCGYPWNLYVKVSGALRYCALMIMAMHGCLLSEIQAPVELRQVFSEKVKKVGTEGAKVLHEIGEKVEKMEKLNPEGNMLYAVQKAAEELQTFIDKKSYLLVNANNWQQSITNEQIVFDNPESFNEIDSQPKLVHENMDILVGRRLSLPIIGNLSSAQPINVNMSSPVSRQGSSEDQHSFRRPPAVSWPSRDRLIDGDNVLNDREVRVFESASALSLVTFTSSLIEFVARLQTVVSSFKELSENANFKDVQSVELDKEKEYVGCWRKIFLCC